MAGKEANLEEVRMASAWIKTLGSVIPGGLFSTIQAQYNLEKKFPGVVQLNYAQGSSPSCQNQEPGGEACPLFPLCGLSFLLSVASLSVNRPSGHVGLRWLSQVNSKLPKASLVLFSLKIPTREKWKGLLSELCFPQQILTHSLVRRSAWVTDTL